jgi:four helix bundle protein
MALQSFKDLAAWQKSMDLTVAVYDATKRFPPDERFGLTNQVRRAAFSVPSNIAEGQGRGPTNDFIRFLTIARGSLQEVDTQLILATRLGFLSDDAYRPISSLLTDVAKLIHGLIRSIPTNN